MAICLTSGLLFVVVVLLMSGTGSSVARRCATRSDVGLHAVAANRDAPTSLPASHDNDTGGAHRPDRTPDADVDANQRIQLCRT